MRKQLNLLILLFLIPILGFSNNTDFTYSRQKTIKKAYLVNSDAGLNIDNSFGNISVTTWDEDKIELDVLIKVSGESEKWVNQKINDIDVDITALKALISAKTIIGSGINKCNRNCNFEINYTIKIPKNGSVTLNNKYGNIISGDLNSSTDIICKYGKIKLGRLNGDTNNIRIDYCDDSSILFLKNSDITSKYSKLKINQVAKLDLTSDYTDVVIQNSDNVKYLGKYGDLNIQKANSLDVSGNYVSIEITELFNQLKFNAKYSDLNVGTVNSKANNIFVVSGYGDISIGFQPNYAFDFAVSTRYADFNYDSDLDINNKSETNNSKVYSGFYKKKGINSVSIKSAYGDVTITKKQ